MERRIIRGFPRARVKAPRMSPFPPAHPAPNIMDAVRQERRTVDYVGFTLPDGSRTILEGLTITPLSVRAWHDANQTITTGTLTILDFNSEIFDNGDLHDLVTNNSRLTCTVAGRYLIIAHGQWGDSEVGMRQMGIKLNATSYLAFVRQGAQDTTFANQCVSTIYDLVEGDYVEVEVKQSSGGDLDVKSYTPHTPAFMMMRTGGS